MNSPHKWPVTRKMLPFDDVIMFPSFFMEDKESNGSLWPDGDTIRQPKGIISYDIDLVLDIKISAPERFSLLGI